MTEAADSSASEPLEAGERKPSDFESPKATGAEVAPIAAQTDDDDQSWRERRNHIVVLAYTTSFALLLISRYAWTLYDKPEPLTWNRGEAFNSFRVDINHATWVEWIQLPGIGQTMAERILSNLDHNGPFRNIDDLMRVHGIGPKTLDRIRPWLTISHDESKHESNAAAGEISGDFTKQ